MAGAQPVSEPEGTSRVCPRHCWCGAPSHVTAWPTHGAALWATTCAVWLLRGALACHRVAHPRCSPGGHHLRSVAAQGEARGGSLISPGKAAPGPVSGPVCQSQPRLQRSPWVLAGRVCRPVASWGAPAGPAPAQPQVAARAWEEQVLRGPQWVAPGLGRSVWGSEAQEDSPGSGPAPGAQPCLLRSASAQRAAAGPGASAQPGWQPPPARGKLHP